MNDVREKLLAAAAQVFSESGYRGATTRRIAQEAGVNEITLFRHFGSKDALILEALRNCGTAAPELATLPQRPQAPFDELLEWARAHHEHMSERRALIRSCMGEMAERPEVGLPATRHPTAATQALAAYLQRLRDHGFTGLPFEPAVSAWMLLAAIFGDAMWRDVMPAMVGTTAEAALAEYVRLTLRAIGVQVPDAAATPPGRAAHTG